MPLNVSKGYHNATAASWGGRAVVDPATGLWHLFVAQFSHGCRVREWTHNSVVVRAVSSEGPAGRGLGSQMMARQYKGVPEYLCRYWIRSCSGGYSNDRAPIQSCTRVLT